MMMQTTIKKAKKIILLLTLISCFPQKMVYANLYFDGSGNGNTSQVM